MKSERIITGQVTSAETRDRLVTFEIAGQKLLFMDPQNKLPVAAGDELCLLVRQSKMAKADEVMIVQHAGREPHYLGVRVPLPLLVLALGLFAAVAIVHADIGWLVPAGALLTLEYCFLQRRLGYLQRYCRLRDSLARTPTSPDDQSAVLALRTGPGKAARLTSLPSEFLELTNDAILIWELDGAGIVYWNSGAERLYGYSREQALGRVSHELLQTENEAGVSGLEKRLARFGLWVGELSHRKASGDRISVQARLSIIAREQRPWLVLEVNRALSDVEESLPPPFQDRMRRLRR